MLGSAGCPAVSLPVPLFSPRDENPAGVPSPRFSPAATEITHGATENGSMAPGRSPFEPEPVPALMPISRRKDDRYIAVVHDPSGRIYWVVRVVWQIGQDRSPRIVANANVISNLIDQRQ